MKVLLNRDLENLGEAGDLVEVADGYARNYLLPKNYALPVSPDNLQKMESVRRARKKREKAELERVNDVAERLEGFLCVVEARANITGNLFGSVTAEIISDILSENGFEGITPSCILLEKPIEHVGDYPVEVVLLPEIIVPITVRVTALEE